MDTSELGRLTAALERPGPDSDNAARALGRTRITAALPALSSALCRDAGWEYTDSALVKAEAIADIGGELAVATLIALLKYDVPCEGANGDVSDEYWRAHQACIHGLVKLGSVAIPALRPLLHHASSDVADSAAVALGRLGET